MNISILVGPTFLLPKAKNRSAPVTQDAQLPHITQNIQLPTTKRRKLNEIESFLEYDSDDLLDNLNELSIITVFL